MPSGGKRSGAGRPKGTFKRDPSLPPKRRWMVALPIALLDRAKPIAERNGIGIGKWVEVAVLKMLQEDEEKL